jgi:hypothetical protein
MAKQDESDADELPNYDFNAPDQEMLVRENMADTGAERMKDELLEHHSTGPRLTGGDVDADWQSAKDVGAEAVGGHAPTPGQDRVDEIGRALGIEQAVDDEVHTHEEILEERDEDRWELDRRSADEETGTSE